MKLINVIGPIDDFDRVVMNYIIDRNVHLEDMFSVFSNTQGLYPYTQSNPYSQLMKQVKETVDLTGINVSDIPGGDYSMPEDEIASYAETLKNMVEAISNKRKEVLSELEENTRLINQLKHIEDVDIPLKDIFGFHHIKVRFGKLPRESYRKLSEFLSEYYAAFFFKFGEDKDGVYGLYCAPIVVREKIDTLFSSLYFERMRISEKASGTPAEVIRNLSDENIELTKTLAGLSKDMEIVLGREREKLYRAYRSAYYLFEAFDVRKYAAHTKESFYIAGWVPESDTESLAKALEKEPNVTLLFKEPDIVKHIKPPTKLYNNWFARPFEKFVGMYGLPSYNEFDPTMFFALTYSLMFGMMYGDAGQGLVLALIGYLMQKKGSFLGPILKICGFSAAVFGLFFGSIFGFELHYGFMYKPMEPENMMTTLILAVVLGTVIIGVSMFFNIANGIKQKDIGKILFDSNGVAGFVFYWATIIGVFSVVRGSSIMRLWYIITFVVLPLVLVFLKEPLSHLLKRRQNWASKNKGEFLLEGFFELFELILSYITNTISFIRVGAFALNHAGMMMVVYSLADVSQTSLANLSVPKVIVLVLGNLLVLGLEGLLVAIQILRLEFYEMFSRYFDGTGKPFTPRIVNQK
ncbi:MAG: V-type ATP synthase subunit I [Firmicutes bacterium ADurb.Bin193]|nr:MAG: V-type ATP synthase subunit I [Firmicutes bacterium ADurb.Bin193]